MTEKQNPFTISSYRLLQKWGVCLERLAILFDLDGTLTDSGEGIINCVTLALRHFGLPVPQDGSLGQFIGPPLRDSFPKFGVPGDRVEEAVAVFRSRYNTVGKFENVPYPGIRELLEKLKQDGHRLVVATSKPEVTAREVLEKFDLAQYFSEICGADMEGKRDTKDAVIAYLLEKLPPRERRIMVGDTVFDIEGAKKHGIPTVAVTWGYGKAGDLTGALKLADSPETLHGILCQIAERLELD